MPSQRRTLRASDSASAAGRVRVQAAMAASSAATFSQRLPLVAKRGSAASSGRPIAAISRRKMGSELPATQSHLPSAQG